VDDESARLERIGEQMLSALEQQQRLWADIKERLQALRCAAISADRLVTATADANGTIVDVQLVHDAFRRTSADRLARSFAEAARAAAESARRQAEELTAPMLAGADPDLSDLLPNAPDLSAVRDLFRWEAPE
jgi:DNA-binding protein YbaB